MAWLVVVHKPNGKTFSVRVESERAARWHVQQVNKAPGWSAECREER